jgi:hypothetical protein
VVINEKSRLFSEGQPGLAIFPASRAPCRPNRLETFGFLLVTPPAAHVSRTCLLHVLLHVLHVAEMPAARLFAIFVAAPAKEICCRPSGTPAVPCTSSLPRPVKILKQFGSAGRPSVRLGDSPTCNCFIYICGECPPCVQGAFVAKRMREPLRAAFCLCN